MEAPGNWLLVIMTEIQKHFICDTNAVIWSSFDLVSLRWAIAFD